METMAWVVLVLGLVGATMLRRHLRETKQIKLRQIIHQERIKAMEHQLPLPEVNDTELAESLTLPSRPPQPGSALTASIVWVRLVTLCLGLTLLLGGVGSTVGLYGVTDTELSGAWPLGLVPAFIGVGLLLFYRMSRGFAAAAKGEGSDA